MSVSGVLHNILCTPLIAIHKHFKISSGDNTEDKSKVVIECNSHDILNKNFIR